MKKVEALTLEEAYKKAATQLACSVVDLECEVIQYPSKGILGFLKKKAIIVARCKDDILQKSKPITFMSKEESVASEIISTVKKEANQEKVIENIPTVEISSKPNTKQEKNAVLDSFFEVDRLSEEPALDDVSVKEESVAYDELAHLIEEQLKELFAHSCFEIDVVEVDVIDNTALIFIDGDDAALLIGKEGYRYNALSYMLFNWLHGKYELFIKLEIAEFLTSQQEMIRKYIKPVVDSIEKHGKGKTRFLDGILVHIALEQLRETFPDKYVAVKTSRDGKKFVVVNEFNNKNNA